MKSSNTKYSPELEWVSPPNYRTNPHSEIAEALRKNPEVWARIYEGIPRSSANMHTARIRKGSNSAYAPAGSFEATVRSTGANTADVFVRYLGETS